MNMPTSPAVTTNDAHFTQQEKLIASPGFTESLVESRSLSRSSAPTIADPRA
ncbi:hypothetical protein [Mycobacterium sp.]|uniref:hypothetical protein n=1 Tax=Mycobacterium sp. TaxID=1785 RepID=UPI003F95B25E